MLKVLLRVMWRWGLGLSCDKAGFEGRREGGKS